ncbi:MAG: lysophospholipid acyltransferase family protein [Ignavibacteriales bacterium]|nr:lysophospholipid acyltransferase family protein [Ignavibacteriales bacterium]
MRLRHILEFAVFQLFVWILHFVPLRFVQKTGAVLGEVVYYLGFRRSITLENLRHAFPGKDDAALERIALEAFRSVSTSLFELLSSQRLLDSGLEKIIQVDNREVFLGARKKGKGVLVLTAHFGNWELMAQSVAMILQSPMLLIVKTQSNHFIDKKVNEWRTRVGNTIIPMEVSVREVLRTLQEGNVVGMAADQTASVQSLSVEFFGRQVPTYEGPATFSLKTGAPIVLTLAIRQQDGTYRLRFHEVPSNDLSEYNKQNIEELTKRHTSLTESIIRDYPGQWMWMHKRWKHVYDSAKRQE